MSRAPANSVKGFNVAGGINLTSKRTFEYFKAMLIISQSLCATIRKRLLQDRRAKFYHKTRAKIID